MGIGSNVPEPQGKPNGPGLWHHKGLMLPPGVQHLAMALRRNGHSESQSEHLAIGIIERWARTGRNRRGHVTARTRKNAAKVVAEFTAERVAARGMRGRR